MKVGYGITGILGLTIILCCIALFFSVRSCTKSIEVIESRGLKHIINEIWEGKK